MNQEYLEDDEDLEEEQESSFEIYDNFARFYDLKHQHFKADLDFYLQMARRSGANPRILELACGSGRIIMHLVKAGFKVTGLDSSPGMLAITRDKLERAGDELKNRVKLVRGDMRNFSFEPEQFDLIFIALNSFQHLLTREDQLACLNNVRQHLAPAGIFIIDVVNPEEKDQYPADGRVEFDDQFRDPMNSNQVQVFLSTVAQPAEQIRHYTYFFDEIKPGGAVNRTVAAFSLRYFYRFELELLLDKAGFAVEDLYGFYDFDEYGPGSNKLIYVCRRR